MLSRVSEGVWAGGCFQESGGSGVEGAEAGPEEWTSARGCVATSTRGGGDTSHPRHVNSTETQPVRTHIETMKQTQKK
jgi:hypothetical protein